MRPLLRNEILHVVNRPVFRVTIFLLKIKFGSSYLCIEKHEKWPGLLSAYVTCYDVVMFFSYDLTRKRILFTLTEQI